MYLKQTLQAKILSRNELRVAIPEPPSFIPYSPPISFRKSTLLLYCFLLWKLLSLVSLLHSLTKPVPFSSIHLSFSIHLYYGQHSLLIHFQYDSISYLSSNFLPNLYYLFRNIFLCIPFVFSFITFCLTHFHQFTPLFFFNLQFELGVAICILIYICYLS